MVEHLVRSVRSGAKMVKSRRLDSTGELKS
jgi:hypothetical protein